MKKFISILSVLALLMGLFTSCGRSDEERSKILKIYNWGDYIDEDVLTDFPKWYKEQTGEEVRIIYQVFDINEIMLTKIERGHEDFDLICLRSISLSACCGKISCYRSTVISGRHRIISTMSLPISKRN